MVNKLPQGCDQQGRHPEAAEAATDLGIEEPEDDSLRVVVEDILLCMAGILLVGVVVLTVAGLA
jgi:hypothetical protein